MRILPLFIFLLIIPGLAKAQGWTELNKQVQVLIQQERFSDAVPIAEKAVAAAKKQYGEGLELAAGLYNLASAYLLNGQLDKPERPYLQAITIYRTKTGEKSRDYANILRALGEFYTATNDFDKADSLFTKTAAIMSETGSETSAENAMLLNGHGDLYWKINRYPEAENCYTKAAAIEKNNSGESSAFYTTYINNLAKLYFNLSQFEKAEPLFLKVKEIRKSLTGEYHSQYASVLSSLADFYAVTGQHQKAVAYFSEALGISRNIYGPDHPRFAALVKKAADFALDMNQFKDAEMLYTKALSVFKNTTGENSVEYGSCCNGLGLLYAKQQQYEKAKTWYALAKEIVRKKFGESHPDYGACLNNLALLYTQTGEYDKAEDYFLQAGEIIKQQSGGYSAEYSTLLDNRVKLYMANGQYFKGEPLIKENNRVIIKNLLSVFSVLSGNEKEQYLANQLQVAENNNSFLYYANTTRSPVCIDNFNLQLQLKSAALNDTRNLIAAVQNNGDSVIGRLYNEWLNNKINLSKEYSLPTAKRRADLKQLEEIAEDLEKELNRRSTLFRHQQDAFKISAGDIQQKMNPDEVAVEFVSFSLYNKGWTDSIIYAAYILNSKDAVPVFIPLCEERQLGKYFSPTGGANVIKALYRSDPVDETDKPVVSGDSLYALIWKPLEAYLTGVKKINYSPAGLLNRIAFLALPAGDSLLLADKYELNRYINLKQIASDSNNDRFSNTAALFGDCRFDPPVAGSAPSKREEDKTIAAGGWKELPGTAGEIETIRTLFSANKAVAYSGINASEEKLKELSGHSPAVLHLATHGFFLPDPEKKKQEGFAADERNAFTMADDPLLRTGIVLSGANRVWLGGEPVQGKEDGIVTAYEIAQLDLSRTELVVLSACETALGDIRGTEGVFGLQRAFKLAGVKNMIVSLWKVPDTETAELMKMFYTQYLQGKSVRNAFTAAQMEMRKKYIPYYWAAFVLIE
jgi:CHAT domain-containing protein/tetratricopeptide (TPR) repeat protein